MDQGDYGRTRHRRAGCVISLRKLPPMRTAIGASSICSTADCPTISDCAALWIGPSPANNPLKYRVCPGKCRGESPSLLLMRTRIRTMAGTPANARLGLGSLLGSLGQVAVSHYSFETIELFREVMARLPREHEGLDNPQPVPISTYVIEVHFDQLPDPSERRFFNSVPTALQLPSATVDRLRHLAGRELADNVEFRRLLSDLREQPIKATSPVSGVAMAKRSIQTANP